MTHKPKTGVLLINLGTPDSTDVSDVRRYLREFLSDPRVLDIPAIGRWLLLNLIILPFRPRKSADAYKEIWTERGSPLKFYAEDLTKKLQEALGPDTKVAFAMRYQNPSIGEVFADFVADNVEKIKVIPLFPQYSSAAWGSAVECLHVEANKHWNVPAMEIIPPFYDDKGFIDAFATVTRASLGDRNFDKILMSFHGLPERHCTKSDVSNNHCLVKKDCCASMVEANTYCYRAQCYATARSLAETLGLEQERYEVCFQSRLGRTPWIQPYTDELITKLANEGTKSIAVICPSFIADCLETTEEIGIRAVEQFKELGGEHLQLVPSLNAEDVWVNAIKGMLS